MKKCNIGLIRFKQAKNPFMHSIHPASLCELRRALSTNGGKNPFALSDCESSSNRIEWVNGIKKIRSLLLCMVLVSAHAGQVNSLIITPKIIATAQKRIAGEVTQLRRKQMIRVGLVLATIGAISAYSVYRWWTAPELPKPQVQPAGTSNDGEKVGETNNNPPKPDITVTNNTPKIGYLHWIGHSIGNTVFNATSFFATMALSSYALATAQCSLVPVVNALNKSYDWRWMTRERTQLYALLWQLKCVAATLDPQSSVFDGLKNVQVAITDHAMVNNQDGALPVMSFDELIKLRALTQKTADNNQRALTEKQLKAVWCLVVEAVVYDLGFIAYKEEEPVVGEVAPFDQHQLGVMRTQLLNQTNTLTGDLDQLLAQTSASISGGLLERVYSYCNTLSWACGVLENNGIVGEV